MKQCKTLDRIYVLKEDGIHLGDDADIIFTGRLVHFGIEKFEKKGYHFNLMFGKIPEKEKYNNRYIEEDGTILPPQRFLDKLWLRDGSEVLIRERRLSKVPTADIWNYDHFLRFRTLLDSRELEGYDI